MANQSQDSSQKPLHNAKMNCKPKNRSGDNGKTKIVHSTYRLPY